MKLRYIALLLILSPIATTIAAYTRNHHTIWYATEVFLVFEIVVFHVICALNLSMIRKIFDNKIVNKHFEVVLTLILCFLWLHLHLIIQLPLLTFITAILCAFNIGLSINQNRKLTSVNNKFKKTIPFYDKTGSTEILPISKRAIYFLRVLSSLISLILSVLCVIHLTDYHYSLMILPLCIALIILSVTAVCISEMNKLVLRAPAIAKRSATRLFKGSKATAALYISDPNAKKFVHGVRAVKDLVKDGVKIAAITRESTAVSPIEKAGAQPVLFAPTIKTLDSFATDSVNTIFYVNDAQKNGHFIRFSQYKHVLIPTGKLLNAKNLPQCVAMYDFVVAPDYTKATEWLDQMRDDNNVNIVVVGSKAQQKDFFLQYLPKKITLGLHIDSSDQFAKGNILIECISELVTNMKTVKDVNLIIVLAKKADFYQTFKKRLYEAVGSNEGLVSFISGGKKLTNQMCDIELIYSRDLIMFENNRMIFLDKSCAPSNEYVFKSGNLGELIDKMKKNQEEEIIKNSAIKSYQNYMDLLQDLEGDCSQ